MCLYATSKRLTAEEDITCYKVLNDDMTALYYPFTYEVGRLYKGKLDMPGPTWNDVDKAFHTYATIVIAQRAAGCGYRKVWRATIPIGAKYYEGACNEYASNQIIIVEQIKQ